mgnify:CR=1 FL=1
MVSEDAFAYFIQSLETLENLLHAETQAIAAKDLDTIDSIMIQKDESLQILLSAKDRLSDDPRNNDLANAKIDYVMNLQSRNANSFMKLKDKASLKSNQTKQGLSSDGKMRSAYLKN